MKPYNRRKPDGKEGYYKTRNAKVRNPWYYLPWVKSLNRILRGKSIKASKQALANS